MLSKVARDFIIDFEFSRCCPPEGYVANAFLAEEAFLELWKTSLLDNKHFFSRPNSGPTTYVLRVDRLQASVGRRHSHIDPSVITMNFRRGTSAEHDGCKHQRIARIAHALRLSDGANVRNGSGAAPDGRPESGRSLAYAECRVSGAALESAAGAELPTAPIDAKASLQSEPARGRARRCVATLRPGLSGGRRADLDGLPFTAKR